MPSEKSASLPEMDLSCECGLFPPGGLCSHHPFCIDKGGNAGVGYANQVPAAFDGTVRGDVGSKTICEGARSCRNCLTFLESLNKGLYPDHRKPRL